MLSFINGLRVTEVYKELNLAYGQLQNGRRVLLTRNTCNVDFDALYENQVFYCCIYDGNGHIFAAMMEE